MSERYQRVWNMLDRLEHRASPALVRQGEMDAEALTAYRRLHPYARRLNYSRLPREIYEPLWAKYKALYAADTARRKRHRARLDALLDELAVGCAMDVQPTMMTVRVGHSYAYSSQTDPNSYARGSLLLSEQLLQARGFSTEIVPVNPVRTDWMTLYDYELRANCTLWQMDAVQRTPVKNRTWVELMCRHQLNPRVYNPFLPHGAVPWDSVDGKRHGALD